MVTSEKNKFDPNQPAQWDDMVDMIMDEIKK
jgi:hypothetical protein